MTQDDGRTLDTLNSILKWQRNKVRGEEIGLISFLFSSRGALPVSSDPRLNPLIESILVIRGEINKR